MQTAQALLLAVFKAFGVDGGCTVALLCNFQAGHGIGQICGVFAFAGYLPFDSTASTDLAKL